MKTISESALQLALVADSERRLIGVVTDGDIRRGLLRGVSLEAPLSEVMNTSPTVIGPDHSADEAFHMMRARSLHHLPVVDSENRLVGLEVLEHLRNRSTYENPVLLMAGGLGSRLGKLTQETPKPLLPVGNRPILETIIHRLRECGFHRIYISVGYLADKVRAHFGDGVRYGVEICYLEEETPLGTAGALGLLPGEIDLPILVMNGDVLTQMDYRHLMAFHRDHAAAATMCLREFSVQIPYGVVSVDGERLTGIEEKPTQNLFVNAGIYVIEPRLLATVPPGIPYDMPQLFEALLAQGEKAVAFPVSEYWMDVGRTEDFFRANDDYQEVFKPR